MVVKFCELFINSLVFQKFWLEISRFRESCDRDIGKTRAFIESSRDFAALARTHREPL
jgi:hypothetical protein